MEAGTEVIARARLICGEQHVLTDPTVLAVYRYDGIRREGPCPLAAILPGCATEVANVVATCAAAGIPYTVRGAGTSRSGGALAVTGGVLLVLTRMRRVIHAEAAELTVEAGVPLASLRPAPGRWLAGDELLGTVGGHIAETAEVGNVAALELVRPDGRLVRLSSSFPGYDIAGSFPGSRGRAGVLVTVTLTLVPQQ